MICVNQNVIFQCVDQLHFRLQTAFFYPEGIPGTGVSQNRRRLLDFDGRWGKLGLGKKIKDDPMGRGGVPPLSLVGAILSIF